jgi:hypothetical protein
MEIKPYTYVILIITGIIVFITLFVYIIVKFFGKSDSDNKTPDTPDTPGSKVVKCAFDCGVNGSCNSTTKKCDCYDGYRGDSCNITCPGENRDCNKNGKCNDSGTCDCNVGFSGVDCATPAQIPKCTDCSNNGVCDQTTGNCVCNKGYSGSDCSFKISDIKFSDGMGRILPLMTPTFDPNITDYNISNSNQIEVWVINITSSNVIQNISICNGCDTNVWGSSPIINGLQTNQVQITNSIIMGSTDFQLPITINSSTGTQTYNFTLKQ